MNFTDSDEDSDWSQYNGTASSSTETCELEESDVGSICLYGTFPMWLMYLLTLGRKEVYNPPENLDNLSKNR